MLFLVYLFISVLSSVASAVYVVQDDYSPNSFADMFDFWTDRDPTNGYVNYVGRDVAQNTGLYNVDRGVVRIGVDSANVASGRGRNSVRITSKAVYNHGLVILDLSHMPGGACGTWPAFWTVNEQWPMNGEVDIIEGVNSQAANSMAMHTSPGCSITNTGKFAGLMNTANCDVNAPGQASNAGCSISSPDTASYGNGFNANGGGVYATQWTSNAVSIWFFPRGAIPADITAGNPDPANWGLPSGQFAGACDIDRSLRDQRLVFDVTFCGDWAGNVWGSDPVCGKMAPTCQSYVQNNPRAFSDMYWAINSLKVFQDNGVAVETVTLGPRSTSTEVTMTTMPTGAITSPIKIVIVRSETIDTISTATMAESTSAQLVDIATTTNSDATITSTSTVLEAGSPSSILGGTGLPLSSTATQQFDSTVSITVTDTTTIFVRSALTTTTDITSTRVLTSTALVTVTADPALAPASTADITSTRVLTSTLLVTITADSGLAARSTAEVTSTRLLTSTLLVTVTADATDAASTAQPEVHPADKSQTTPPEQPAAQPELSEGANPSQSTQTQPPVVYEIVNGAGPQEPPCPPGQEPGSDYQK